MKKYLLYLVALLAVYTYVVPAYAENNEGYHYLAATGIMPDKLIPPLAEGSTEKKSEVKEILKLQHNASADEVALAADEQKLRPELLTAVIGADFSRKIYPVTFSLLDNVGSDCRKATDTAKDYWNVVRPYMANENIKTLVPEPNTNGSYPSGHTACSKVWAEVLGNLMPLKHDALSKKADSIAQHRVLAGMHYPNDLKGGRQLAVMIMTVLKHSQVYLKDLNNARDEIHKIELKKN